MTFPNLDNTFLASLSLYRRLRGGKWYLRHYKQLTGYGPDGEFDYPSYEAWSRYGKYSPMSYVVKSEDYTPPPYNGGYGPTLTGVLGK